MKKIILATSNLGKVRELNSMLEGHYNVVSQIDMKVEEVPETGASFIENALIKARNASSQSQLPALADDSGLVVDALNGEPGIYSARYAGENASDEDNIIKLLSRMDDVDDRGASSAQLSAEEKNRKSHRGQALQEILKHLLSLE